MSYGQLVATLLLLCGCSAPTAVSTQSAAPTDRAGTARKAGGITQATPADPLTALAALAPEHLDRSSPAGAAFLRRYFANSCEPDERLAFDTVCQHYGPARSADPSPWPDLIVGIHGGRLASAVLVGRQAPLEGWTCEALPLPGGLRTCFAPGVSHEDQILWSQQWAAFLSAAD